MPRKKECLVKIKPKKLTTRYIKKYGWVRDLPDGRDLLFSAALETMGALPSKVDLRPQCPSVYDQGQLGSCTANAIAGALEFDEIKEKKPNPWVPSRLFIYYNERLIEGTVSSDSGAQLRDGVKAVANQGACPETDWPYVITKFKSKPPAKAFSDASQDKARQYLRIPQASSQMKSCLADGFPFVFGFTVYESFESQQVASTGNVPMPNTSTEKVLGGHAVCAVGYDDSKQVFIVRNSWGPGWGLKGYCMMPYAYLLDAQLASDFWTIRQI
jgi:C1A family cysteine protease